MDGFFQAPVLAKRKQCLTQLEIDCQVSFRRRRFAERTVRQRPQGLELRRRRALASQPYRVRLEPLANFEDLGDLLLIVDRDFEAPALVHQ